MEYATLSNGVKMPMVGLGTHGIPNDQIGKVMALSYELGYRKFDTAWLYQNEKYIGKAIQDNHIPREDIFLTSKLHINDLYFKGYHPHSINIPTKSVKRAFEQTCKRLKTDYLDLYLIHWPFHDFCKMWDCLVDLYEKGRIRAIGVSSFLPQHLDQLMGYSNIVPLVNQFEVNPFNSQIPETLYNQEKGIHVEAYASFGTTRKTEVASIDIINHPIFVNLAQKKNKTTSQIILRWSIQRGISVIPRSKSKNHLQENLDIFDFTLDDEEMKLIDTINENKYSRGNPHLLL